MSRLEIDPHSATSVRDQLVNQLRYLIACGHFTVNDTLPSTRSLAEQLDISFHTVRKAYQELASEGLLQSQVGSGYTIKERTPLPKTERMERGAKVVNETLQQLIGLGLNDAEIESLFQEQATLLDHAGLDRKLITVSPHPELNHMCADQIGKSLQKTVLPVPPSQLERHEDADFVFTPYRHLSEVLEAIPRADTLGYATHLPSTILERVARLREHETLGLVTRYQDTVAVLTDELRTATAFDGQVVAASIDQGTEHLHSFVEETDLLLSTPASYRQLRPFVDEDIHEHRQLQIVVSQDSLDAITAAVPA